MAWTRNNEIRRQRIGNAAIRFMTLCAMIDQSRENPAINPPNELNGVSVEVRRIGNHLVMTVTGWPILAVYLINDETIRNNDDSVGAMLMSSLLRLGMIEHRLSRSFGETNNTTKGQILNDVQSVIAVSHPEVDRLEGVQVRNITAYASSSAGNANNRAYMLANTPGFYIDNVRYNSAAQVQTIVGVSKQVNQRFVKNLKQRFFRTNQQVEGTLNNVRVICKLERM